MKFSDISEIFSINCNHLPMKHEIEICLHINANVNSQTEILKWLFWIQNEYDHGIENI